MKILKSLCFALLLSSTASYALIPNAIHASYGWGDEYNLQGSEVGVEWSWDLNLITGLIGLNGFWSFDIAHWHSDADPAVRNRDIQIFSFGPMIRLQTISPLFNWLTPYIEAGISPSYMTDDHLAGNDLGSKFTFRDTIGGGFMLGKNQHFLVSYHYYHYSNAGLANPNDGIDVQYVVTLGYQF